MFTMLSTPSVSSHFSYIVTFHGATYHVLCEVLGSMNNRKPNLSRFFPASVVGCESAILYSHEIFLSVQFFLLMLAAKLVDRNDIASLF